MHHTFATAKKWIGDVLGAYTRAISSTAAITTTSTITGGDLAATDDLTVGDDATITGDLTVSTLTAARVVYTGTAGLLSTEAALGYVAGTDTLTAGNVTVTSAATVGTTLGVTGATTLTGGVAQAVAPHGFANWQPIAATSGTDTTPANDTQFVTSIWVPANKTITNINYLVGSVGGTDKVYGVIYDASGTNVAATAVTAGGATVGTAAQIQTVALTATYAAKGPALYYVGISMNGNTARLRTVPAYCSAGLFAGSVTQTHGTVGAITEPVTFTADKAPIVFLD